MVGKRLKATAARPESTILVNSAGPRMPPMKSIFLLVRGSVMPRSGERTRSWRAETSSWEMGSASGEGVQERENQE